MATALNPIPLETYMHTEYSPDCEYVDGAILERNVGQGNHSFTQTKLSRFLDTQLEARGLVTLVEQRTRVSPYRVRVPDVCVVETLEPVTSKPPLLCIEIYSPDDQWRDLTAKIGEYFQMGVPCVWVIDPWSRRGWIFDGESAPREVVEFLEAPNLELQVPLRSVLPPE